MNKPESLITTKKRKLDVKDIEIFSSCAFFEIKKAEVTEDMANEFIYQVLSKRLQYFKIPVNQWLIVFISCIIDSPGKAVMWAYTLNEIYKKVNKEITFDDFINNGFGDGLPTEEEYKRIWDAQKVKPDYPNSDNALDNPNNWI